MIRYSVSRSVGILMLGVFAFFMITPWDHSWTLYLWKHAWPRYTDITARSLFEGNYPGFSDLGVIVPIMTFLFCLWRRFAKQPYDLSQRKLLFVALSGLFSSAIFVQILKVAISRARPKVFTNEMAESLAMKSSEIFFPGFMGIFGPRGYSWNSFPSGHTATCTILLSLVYLSWKFPYLRYLTLFSVLTFVIVMAVGRAMAGMHWLSDSIASFFIVWAVVDAVWLALLKKEVHVGN